jgi:hypothetical protein
MEYKDLIQLLIFFGSCVSIYITLRDRIIKLEQQLRFDSSRIDKLETIAKQQLEKNEELLNKINESNNVLTEIKVTLKLLASDKNQLPY